MQIAATPATIQGIGSGVNIGSTATAVTCLQDKGTTIAVVCGPPLATPRTNHSVWSQHLFAEAVLKAVRDEFVRTDGAHLQWFAEDNSGMMKSDCITGMCCDRLGAVAESLVGTAHSRDDSDVAEQQQAVDRFVREHFLCTATVVVSTPQYFEIATAGDNWIIVDDADVAKGNLQRMKPARFSDSRTGRPVFHSGSIGYQMLSDDVFGLDNIAGQTAFKKVIRHPIERLEHGVFVGTRDLGDLINWAGSPLGKPAAMHHFYDAVREGSVQEWLAGQLQNIQRHANDGKPRLQADVGTFFIEPITEQVSESEALASSTDIDAVPEFDPSLIGVRVNPSRRAELPRSIDTPPPAATNGSAGEHATAT